MLNKLRDSLQPILSSLGSLFASTGLSPNFWTTVSLILAFGAAVAYSTKPLDYFDIAPTMAPLIGGLLLLISGFFDIVDGSVARITGTSSKKGAFLDSTFDRIAEIVIYVGITIGGFTEPMWTMTALGCSLLVSYTRARGESLGLEIKGTGLGERAERLLILAVVGMMPFSFAMNIAIIIVSLVAAITIVQRVALIIRRL